MSARRRSHRARLKTLVAALLAVTWMGCGQDRSEVTSPASELAQIDRGVQAAIAAQDRHADRLMELPGVVGLGTGLDADGQAVVRVFTRTPDVAGIPDRLDGVPVTRVVTGMILARADPTSRFPRPVPIGVSTGHPDITAGTIGARVTDGTDVFALSNNHVYADVNEASLGDPALQPGPSDGGSDPEDRIGTLYDFEPIDFSGNNQIDAAIAISSTDSLDVATPNDGYGTPSANIFGDGNGDGTIDNVDDLLNVNVQKYGRTTGLTQGTISEVNVTVEVCYECAGPFCFNCKRSATFVDQIGITPGDFSGGGDSGSLIVTESGAEACGLLFAGSSNRTLANRIDHVLNRFNVAIDDGSGTVEPTPTTDLAVSSVSAPSSVTEGDVVSVDVTVENVGTEDVTSDVNVTLTDDTDAVEIGTQTISGGLAAGSSTTLTYSWDTSGASTGDHTLTASHDLTDDDAGNNSSSTTVTVNAPSTGLEVTGIDPNTVQAGNSVDVTITGSGFAAGASVALENGSGPTPSVSNIVVVDATEITATISTKSGGPPRDRIWDVRVTNPDGASAVLQGGFTVTP